MLPIGVVIQVFRKRLGDANAQVVDDRLLCECGQPHLGYHRKGDSFICIHCYSGIVDHGYEMGRDR